LEIPSSCSELFMSILLIACFDFFLATTTIRLFIKSKQMDNIIYLFYINSYLLLNFFHSYFYDEKCSLKRSIFQWTFENRKTSIK
jgi:hypothetical protein